MQNNLETEQRKSQNSSYSRRGEADGTINNTRLGQVRQETFKDEVEN